MGRSSTRLGGPPSNSQGFDGDLRQLSFDIRTPDLVVQQEPIGRCCSRPLDGNWSVRLTQNLHNRERRAAITPTTTAKDRQKASNRRLLIRTKLLQAQLLAGDWHGTSISRMLTDVRP